MGAGLHHVKQYIVDNFLAEWTDGMYNYLSVRPMRGECLNCGQPATVAQFDVESADPYLYCTECYNANMAEWQMEEPGLSKTIADAEPSAVAEAWAATWEETGRTWPYVARVVAKHREESEPCQAGTPGCCIDHDLDHGSCEGY